MTQKKQTTGGSFYVRPFMKKRLKQTLKLSSDEEFDELVKQLNKRLNQQVFLRYHSTDQGKI